MLLGALAGALACESRAGQASPGASAQPVDRYADGSLLVAEKARWKALWPKIPPLPACSGVEQQYVELCTRAETARQQLQTLELQDAPDEALLDAILELSLAAVAARDTLQAYSFKWLVGNPAAVASAAAAASASASPLPPGMIPVPPAPAPSASAARPKAKGLHVREDVEAAHQHEGELPLGEDPNPWAATVREYEATLRLALSRFAYYLEFAPLPVRHQARARVVKLIDAHPRTLELRRLVNEAWITERDATARAALAELRAKLGVGVQERRQER